jgi:hypothetical protein
LVDGFGALCEPCANRFLDIVLAIEARILDAFARPLQSESAGLDEAGE